MMSTSGGLNPRAVAGRPSVTRLTQSSWTGMRASGNPRAAVRNILERGGGGRSVSVCVCAVCVLCVCVLWGGGGDQTISGHLMAREW